MESRRGLATHYSKSPYFVQMTFSVYSIIRVTYFLQIRVGWISKISKIWSLDFLGKKWIFSRVCYSGNFHNGRAPCLFFPAPSNFKFNSLMNMSGKSYVERWFFACLNRLKRCWIGSFVLSLAKRIVCNSHKEEIESHSFVAFWDRNRISAITHFNNC